jgi:hypothetical protein
MALTQGLLTHNLKPTLQEFLDDLVRCLCTLPYAVECVRARPEGPIMIDCKEGTFFSGPQFNQPHLIKQGSK